MSLIIPPKYKLKLLPETTEMAIKMLKDAFQERLSKTLNLRRVTAPLFVLSGTGLNDDLNGSERAVSFPIADMGGRQAEVVHSLAKWKRVKLGAYDIAPGFGLYTDMNAIRTHEELDNLHSLYVDQWDWEKTITREDRNVEYLKKTVKSIYKVIKECESLIYAEFPHITPTLPDEITFIHTEELLQEYPRLSPKEREAAVARRYGAVFLIGIGQQLSDGTRHDGRAPDYDDWELNGDILYWNEVLGHAFEISSMGIRVDPKSLDSQLTIAGCDDRRALPFHKMLLNGELPLTMGGGIGQSRLCMLLLGSAHIGEVQASVWDQATHEACAKAGIPLL